MNDRTKPNIDAKTNLKNSFISELKPLTMQVYKIIGPARDVERHYRFN
jgi:hypothetical protein